VAKVNKSATAEYLGRVLRGESAVSTGGGKKRGR
jgi:hypothetical protein